MSKRKSNKKILIALAIVLIVLLVAVVVAFVLGGQPRRKNVEDLLKLGQKYVEEQAYNQAIVDIDEAVAIEPRYKDIRFEECVVDGVLHHGYDKYDLTEEEDAYLQNIIDLAQGEQYEEAINALEYERLIKLMKNCGKWEKKSSEEAFGEIHIAFHDYKVFIRSSVISDGEWDWNFDDVEMAIIPLDEGGGYYFRRFDIKDVSGDFGDMCWAVSECAGGMFEGEFTRYAPSGTGNITGTVTGTMKNGLLDGFVTEYCNNEYSDPSYYRWEYDKGKAKIFKIEEEELLEKGFWFYYGYETDESGNALLNADGSYKNKVGDWDTDKNFLDKRRQSIGTYWLTVTEHDGFYEIYPW